MKEYWPMMLVIVIAMAAFTLLWRQGYFLKLSAYCHETQEELKKCTWPTWDELMGSTVVVIVSVALLGVYTFGVDALVTVFVQFIMQG